MRDRSFVEDAPPSYSVEAFLLEEEVLAEKESIAPVAGRISLSDFLFCLCTSRSFIKRSCRAYLSFLTRKDSFCTFTCQCIDFDKEEEEKVQSAHVAVKERHNIRIGGKAL